MSDNLDRNLRKLMRLSGKPHVPPQDSADRVFDNVMKRMKGDEQDKQQKDTPEDESLWFLPALKVAAVLLVMAGLIGVYLYVVGEPDKPEPIAKGPAPVKEAPSIAPTPKVSVVEIATTDAPETRKLKDGSTITVAEASLVKVTTWPDLNRPLIELDAGSVRCVVEKGPGSFRVSTPVGEAVALGTEFEVRLKPKTAGAETKGEAEMNRAVPLLMMVSVLSGEVMVSDLGGLGRLACAGETVEVAQEQTVVEKFRSGQLVPRLSDGKQGEPLAVRKHGVNITVRDQIALVEVDQVFYNPSDDRLEGTFFFPLPNGASICRLAMYVGDNLMEGEIAEAKRARRTFEALKVQRIDPALLEWAGGNNFKMRVWPIEPKSEKRVMISYYQVLEKENNQIKVHYPLVTDALQKHPIGELDIKLTLDSTPTIEQVRTEGFVPEMDRQPNHVGLKINAKDTRPDRDFVAEFDLAKGEGELVVLPFWHAPDGNGYFLMIFSPELETLDSKRDVGSRFVFVVDKSGGLGSKHLALARKAVESALTMLKPADEFGIVAYDTFAQPFNLEMVEASAENLGAAKEFLGGLKAMGASDLSNAWRSAAVLAGDQPTQIVYIGSGLSSLTSTKSGKLLQEVSSAFGAAPVRIHCMPVGSIQDADFIHQLAGRYSGTVRPLNSADDIEPGVADLVLDYGLPIYQNFELSFEGIKVDEIYPKSLPNIAAGRQLFVYGKYLNQGDARIELKAQYKKQPYHKVFDVKFGAQTANTCVPPLWATRKIEHLQRETTFAEADDSNRMVRTIVETSKRYTVMSQYTSFLVLETPEDYARYGIERRVREFGPYAGQGGESASQQLDRLQQQMGRLMNSAARMKKSVKSETASFERAEETAMDSENNDGAADPGGVDEAMPASGAPALEKPQASAVPDAPEMAAKAAPKAAGLRLAEEEKRKSLSDIPLGGTNSSRAMRVMDARGGGEKLRYTSIAEKESGKADFETDQLAWARTDIFPGIEHAPSLGNWPRGWKHSPADAMDLLRTLQSRLQSLACEVTAFHVDAKGKETQQGKPWQLVLDLANKRYVTHRKGEDTKDVCDGKRLARFFPLLKYAATRSATPQDATALAAALPGYLIPWPEKLDREYMVTVEKGEGVVLRLTRRGNSNAYVRLFLDSKEGPISKIEIYQPQRQKNRKYAAVLAQTIYVDKFEEVGGIKVPSVLRVVQLSAGVDPRVVKEMYERRHVLTERLVALRGAGEVEEAKKVAEQLKPFSNVSEQVIRLTDIRPNAKPPAELFKIDIPADWAVRDLDSTPKSGDRRGISHPYDPSARGFGRR